MAYRLAKWHEIQACKRAFATLPGAPGTPHHELERVWYTVHGFKDLISGGGMGLQPFARVSRESDPGNLGYYPVKALAFETDSGEIVK